MLRCNNNVSASLAGVTLVCLECIWKKLHCTESSSQFRTFYYCSTIYTSTYNFECINFHIIFLFVCLNVWCGSSSDETWDENINCSCHGCRLKNYYYFFPLDQKDRTTGSPNHGHASYWVKRGRKNWAKWQAALLECLFLLRFDECWEENAERHMDGTEKWQMDGWDG